MTTIDRRSLMAVASGIYLAGLASKNVMAAENTSPAVTPSFIAVKGMNLGEGRPKVIVPITGKTEADVIAKAQMLASHADVDMVEFRIDYLDDVADASKIAALTSKVGQILTKKPVIVTMRTKAEGGNFAISDADYLATYKTILESGSLDFLDVELFREKKVVQALVATAHAKNVKIIMSSHDFAKTPPKEEMISRLRRMDALGADVLKIAAMPHDAGDVLRLLDATWTVHSKFSSKPMITMSMAGTGVISRMSGEVFGSAATFGMIGQASAPGQIDASALAATLSTIDSAMTKS